VRVGERERAYSLSVVIPVYNAGKTIDPVVAELIATLDQAGYDFEVVLVDDGSRDSSWQHLTALCALDERVRAISLMRNYGQHNALLAGVRQASKELVATMDDDGEHPPSELLKIVNHLSPDLDVVYGVPREQQHGFFRDIASVITKLVLQKAMGAETARRVSALRVFRRQLRLGFSSYRSSFVSLDVLLTWSTTRFSALEVEHRPRQSGESTYTVWMLLNHAVTMMTGYSTLPLQLASFIGFGFTIFGFLILIFVLARTLIQGVSVPGFAFLASVVALFSGAQLFALGIIGEYLGRAHFRLMDRPAFTIRDQIGLHTQDEVVAPNDSFPSREFLV
jgi:glycosyltransferase involved in cell wall biosynthesis